MDMAVDLHNEMMMAFFKLSVTLPRIYNGSYFLNTQNSILIGEEEKNFVQKIEINFQGIRNVRIDCSYKLKEFNFMNKKINKNSGRRTTKTNNFTDDDGNDDDDNDDDQKISKNKTYRILLKSGLVFYIEMCVIYV